MKFSPSLAAEHFLEAIHPRVGARHKTVLARSALLLALGETIPPDFHPADSQGKDLDDNAIISDELHDLLHAALNHRAGHALDEAAYRHSFRLHFEYGCHRLNELWHQSGNDQTRFIATLLLDRAEPDATLAHPHSFSASDGEKVAEGRMRCPPERGEGLGVRAFPRLPLLLDRGEGRGEESSGVQKEIKLKVLSTAPDWSLNGPGTSNGLLVISGQPGSGKSQLALDLLAQLAAQGVRFIFFDMRGELNDDRNSPEDLAPPLTAHASRITHHAQRFLEQTRARCIRLIHEGLPINPLYRDPNPTINAQIAYEIANLIRCFAPQFGPRQEDSFCKAYQRLPAPDFPSLVHALENTATPGVDLAIVQKIDRLKLFASADTALNPETWLNHSLVIDFKEFGSDSETKALSAALILNFLMKKLSRNLAIQDGIQPLKMVLFVDEAHLLLPKENKAGLLGSLARQGRSWGFPVWLASQDADAFITTGANPTNFAELAECGVHFSPHTLTDAQQRLILGGIIPRRLPKGQAALRLQGTLVTGPARQFWKDGGHRHPLLLDRGEGRGEESLSLRRAGSKAETATAPPHNPGGIPENSPAFQCRDQTPAPTSPAGTAELGATAEQELLQSLIEIERLIEARSNPTQPDPGAAPNTAQNDATKSAA